ncbi:hypothetical protein [Rossellomorea aquimaris]|nr:hypothetical protein [Rossellomorea aquimaris]
MGKEQESLSDEIKKKDSDFDKEMLGYNEEIEKLKENILDNKE